MKCLLILSLFIASLSSFATEVLVVDSENLVEFSNNVSCAKKYGGTESVLTSNIDWNGSREREDVVYRNLVGKVVVNIELSDGRTISWHASKIEREYTHNSCYTIKNGLSRSIANLLFALTSIEKGNTSKTINTLLLDSKILKFSID